MVRLGWLFNGFLRCLRVRFGGSSPDQITFRRTSPKPGWLRDWIHYRQGRIKLVDYSLCALGIDPDPKAASQINAVAKAWVLNTILDLDDLSTDEHARLYQLRAKIRWYVLDWLIIYLSRQIDRLISLPGHFLRINLQPFIQPPPRSNLKHIMAFVGATDLFCLLICHLFFL